MPLSSRLFSLQRAATLGAKLFSQSPFRSKLGLDAKNIVVDPTDVNTAVVRLVRGCPGPFIADEDIMALDLQLDMDLKNRQGLNLSMRLRHA